MFRVVQRPSKSSAIAQVAASATDSYFQYRIPMDLITNAAANGLLVDPGATPYRPWDTDLPLRGWFGVHRHLSVFYSPHQLLALRPIEQLLREVSGTKDANGKVTLHLDPLTPDEIAALDGGRQLAILLSALDMHYLPRILLTIYYPQVWDKEDPAFEAAPRPQIFSLSPRTCRHGTDAT